MSLKAQRVHGVDLRCAVSVLALEGEDGRLRRARLSDGDTLEVGLAVAALGAVRKVEWLAGSLAPPSPHSHAPRGDRSRDSATDTANRPQGRRSSASSKSSAVRPFSTRSRRRARICHRPHHRVGTRTLREVTGREIRLLTGRGHLRPGRRGIVRVGCAGAVPGWFGTSRSRSVACRAWSASSLCLFDRPGRR
jgi:hypothetical protein